MGEACSFGYAHVYTTSIGETVFESVAIIIEVLMTSCRKKEQQRAAMSSAKNVKSVDLVWQQEVWGPSYYNQAVSSPCFTISFLLCKVVY